MKHVLSALCNRVLIDQVTQSVTLVDLADSLFGPIQADAEGAFPVALDFLTIWLRDDLDRSESGRSRLSILNATNRSVGPTVEYEVDLVASQKARSITRFPGFPFRGTGLHRVVIEKEIEDGQWEEVASWPILISSVGAANAPA